MRQITSHVFWVCFLIDYVEPIFLPWRHYQAFSFHSMWPTLNSLLNSLVVMVGFSLKSVCNSSEFIYFECTSFYSSFRLVTFFKCKKHFLHALSFTTSFPLGFLSDLAAKFAVFLCWNSYSIIYCMCSLVEVYVWVYNNGFCNNYSKIC